jgi:anti-anti-sigma regulatory factor
LFLGGFMSGLQINRKNDEDSKIRIKLSGSMDEHSDYSKVPMDFTHEVIFDFDDIDHINSTGIKHWVQWITKVQDSNPELKFTFINCPKPIVDQINMVDGFLPINSKVKSFKVPYFCETCDKDTVFTFIYGRDYDKKEGKLMLNIPSNRCNRKDCEMEPDVVEQKYFKFLK